MPENPTTSASAYLNCEQAGAHLNLSPRTLEKLRTIGGGPRFRKLGRRIVYKIVDLDAWAESRACESTSDPVYTALRACRLPDPHVAEDRIRRLLALRAELTP